MLTSILKKISLDSWQEICIGDRGAHHCRGQLAQLPGIVRKRGGGPCQEERGRCSRGRTGGERSPGVREHTAPSCVALVWARVKAGMGQSEKAGDDVVGENASDVAEHLSISTSSPYQGKGKGWRKVRVPPTSHRVVVCAQQAGGSTKRDCAVLRCAPLFFVRF